MLNEHLRVDAVVRKVQRSVTSFRTMRKSLQSTYSVVSFAVGLFCGIFFRHLTLFSAESSSYILKLLAVEASSPETPDLASWQAPSATRDYEPLGVEDTDEPWWENFETNRTLYLSVLYGLGNTIPSIASALTVAYREKINVKVTDSFFVSKNCRGLLF